MVKQLLVILFFLLGCFSNAQNNLVPNWSFESITTCPSNIIANSALYLAMPWGAPSMGTPDLFNSCDTVVPPFETCPTLGIPCNWKGSQLPRTGIGYSGIYPYGLNISGGNYREYIQVPLINKLVANKRYCVSFYASLSETSMYATSRLGAFISTNAISSISDTTIPVIPQIEPTFNNYIKDTVLWTEIKGIYTAGRGENYITIGNFYNNKNTDTLFVNGRHNFNQEIYYYLDDVSLVAYDEAYAGSDTTICKGTYANLGDTLGASFGAVYNWSVLHGDSSSILYNTSLANTFASPKKTTTYILQKQQCGIYSYDTITVKIPASYTANAGIRTTL